MRLWNIWSSTSAFEISSVNFACASVAWSSLRWLSLCSPVSLAWALPASRLAAVAALAAGSSSATSAWRRSVVTRASERRSATSSRSRVASPLWRSTRESVMRVSERRSTMFRPFSSRRRMSESSRPRMSASRRRCSPRSPTKRPFCSSRLWSFSSSRVFSSTRNCASSTAAAASRWRPSSSDHSRLSRRTSSTASWQVSSERRASSSSKRLALSTWRTSGRSCRASSRATSLARTRFLSMSASFLCERSLRRRCLEMPAASSTRLLRSSGLLARMESSLPCEMMECVSLPRPESCRMSWMSMRRAGEPLIRYSDSPERYIRRVMPTSEKSTGSVWSVLSSTSVTSATPTGLRALEPEKTTSSMAWPRSILALCSPRTQRMASETLDLPEPLGPTTTVRPGSNTMCVRSAKDLKPFSVRDFRYTGCPPRQGVRWRLPRRRSRPPSWRSRRRGRAACPGRARRR